MGCTYGLYLNLVRDFVLQFQKPRASYQRKGLKNFDPVAIHMLTKIFKSTIL